MDRAWYSILDRYIQKQGFKKGNADNNIYIKLNQGSIFIIEFYVDDIIFGSDDDRMSKFFYKDMQNEFKISLFDCKPVSTPMKNNCKLRKYDKSKDAYHRLYRLMIDNLLYVTSSRSDVMQEVG
jgi:hypothetical protein